MNRNWYKPLVWLMWLALPATALNYWRAWEQLPCGWRCTSTPTGSPTATRRAKERWNWGWALWPSC